MTVRMLFRLLFIADNYQEGVLSGCVWVLGDSLVWVVAVSGGGGRQDLQDKRIGAISNKSGSLNRTRNDCLGQLTSGNKWISH